MAETTSEQMLTTIMSETNKLDADQQLRLAAYLIERARTAASAPAPQRRWRDLCGLYTYPALGEDAQKWVSRTRSEGDDRRAYS